MEKKKHIKILRQPEKNACGGTTATQDLDAPKTIRSEEMTLFDVSTALGHNFTPNRPREEEEIHRFSAFAARCGEGVFLFLETETFPRRQGSKDRGWTYVREDRFPELTALVREYDLAAKNGFHSTTHGLPENFGGSVEIGFSSGEEISFSNNQTPVLSREAALKIIELFRTWMKGEKIPLPAVSSLTAIRYEENRKGGGYTRAEMTIQPDGSGINEKKARYDGPTVYESRKPVEAQTVQSFRDNIEATGILAWPDLPESGYDFIGDKKLTFVFGEGNEISVSNKKIVPDPIRNGFFNIELEITTKH